MRAWMLLQLSLLAGRRIESVMEDRQDQTSEIQSLPYDSDEEQQDYPEQRPFNDTSERRYPNYHKYEGGHDDRVNYPDPAHRKMDRSSGSVVKFYRNGDVDNGMTLAIDKYSKTFDALLLYLSDKMPTPTGIHHIFKWPEGNEIKSVSEFQNRRIYIVSSTKKLKRNINGVGMKYGNYREEVWWNKKMASGKLHGNKVGLYKKPKGHNELPVRNL